MITKVILDAVFGSINALLALIPGTESNGLAIGNFEDVTTIVWNANGIIPLTSIMFTVGSIFALKIAFILWDATLFVYHQFWGSD